MKEDEKPEVYGSKIVRPEMGLDRLIVGEGWVKPEDTQDRTLIPLKALKGIIYGFYSPSPWMVWVRIQKIPYGMEITRCSPGNWWRRYCIKLLRTADNN